MTDLILAILHHFFVFGLVGLLFAEAVLVQPGMTGRDVDRVVRIDGAYGAVAGIVLVAGIARVVFGAKGPEYYLQNPWFWAKMASFAAVGLLSIPPTVKFLAWRRRRRAEPGFLPSDAEIGAVSRIMGIERLFLLPILIFAATMARIA